MAAQDPFLGGTQAEQGLSGGEVEDVGFEFYAKHFQLLKSILEHQGLHLGIDACPLKSLPQPGPSDFDPLIPGKVIAKPGGTENLLSCFVNHHQLKSITRKMSGSPSFQSG
jgi:hypothetical protein